MMLQDSDDDTSVRRAIVTVPPPNFYINQQQLDQLIGLDAWKINELPLETASRIKTHFGIADAFAFFSSGIKLPPVGSPRDKWRVGIDWVRMETNPKHDEPALNVCHYVVGNHQPGGYPVYGPVAGSLAPHWSELKDLDVYLDPPSKGA